MAIFLGGKNRPVPRFRYSNILQRLNQTAEGSLKGLLYPEVVCDSVTRQVGTHSVNDEVVGTLKQRMMDARITRAVPHFSWSVCKILRGSGFEAYIDGRCFSHLNSLLLQRFKHTVQGKHTQLYPNMDSDIVTPQDNNTADITSDGELVDMSKWRKVDARTLGITNSMIPTSCWTVLNVLKRSGFEAYLVGGCVRDLLLNKVPKDFDVITTANLKQIRKQFHRALVVGQRFPICIVQIKGYAIEVSSFDTVAHNAGKEKVRLSQMPSSCSKKDFIRWKDSIRRDFTINSLFLDPFLFKIYDYSNGMADLRSLKLQTLIPAHFSFKEDCARILRGIRIAARLGLSFSKDTVTAINKFSSSIKSLGEFRIMLEVNYMLSYGAAEPSISLLRKFNLLAMVLPYQAAYLDQEAKKRCDERSNMLMKLLFNMDKLVSCDQPTNCRLWIGLLAFHQVLVQTPQDALVIWAFASVLYRGKWLEAIKASREEYSSQQVKFDPEISDSSNTKSDDEIAKKVARLASLVQKSVNSLTESDSLRESMFRYPNFPCSGSVFVPKKAGRDVAKMFDGVVNNIESYKTRKPSLTIDYDLLKKGDPHETRFALGKVILETLRGGGPVNDESPQHLEVIVNECSSEESSNVLVKNSRRLGQQVTKQHNENKPKPPPFVVENQDVVLKYGSGRKNQKVDDTWEFYLGRDISVGSGSILEVGPTIQVPESTMETSSKTEAFENDKVKRPSVPKQDGPHLLSSLFK